MQQSPSFTASPYVGPLVSIYRRRRQVYFNINDTGNAFAIIFDSVDVCVLDFLHVSDIAAGVHDRCRLGRA
jgi:hypothetical protein